MSSQKQIFAHTVHLLTKKNIYVRRVRPNALELSCLARSVSSWGLRGMFLIAPIAIVLGLTTAMSVAYAEHETDHRFIVEGYVCGSDGHSMANQEVMVKDTRIPLGKTTYTDSDGFYTITLHLHNENQCDPILVAAGDREQRLTAKFDPKDMKTERKMTVNIGSGCEGTHTGVGKWMYYSVGLGLAGVAAFAGARFMRKQRRPAKRGKTQRK
jgi:hypothetical protein